MFSASLQVTCNYQYRLYNLCCFCATLPRGHGQFMVQRLTATAETVSSPPPNSVAGARPFAPEQEAASGIGRRNQAGAAIDRHAPAGLGMTVGQRGLAMTGWRQAVSLLPAVADRAAIHSAAAPHEPSSSLVPARNERISPSAPAPPFAIPVANGQGFMPFPRRARGRSACGGSRWCRRRSRRAWHRAAAGLSDSR